MTFLFPKWQFRLLDDERVLRWVEADAAAARSEEGGSTIHLGAAGLEDGGPSQSACGSMGAESRG